MRSVAATFAFATLAVNGDKFDDFKAKFVRTYANPAEEEYRRKVFDENLAIIDASNAKGKSFTLGVGRFADLTFSEFKSQWLTGFQMTNQTLTGTKLGAFRAPQGFVAPASIDWTTKGCVTPVKNQGQCGSCWSFSTTGALEGAACVAGRGLVSLSEQDLIDCDTGGSGCGGGLMTQAFGWVKTNGITSEKQAPYQCSAADAPSCKASTCAQLSQDTKVLKPGDVTSIVQVDQTEDALEAAVAQQPVSIAIEADHPAFQHYKGGVLTDESCGEKLDHGVLIVGYGTDAGQKYWKVKNSWGTVYGEDGYVLLERGSFQKGGECGVRQAASFPVVSKGAPKEIIV